MTWSAARPGTAVRVLRAAVVRRALQVGLLVGGLFVLGFLCGAQAHAADGTGALPGKAAGQLVQPPAEPMAKHTATPTATVTPKDTVTPAFTDTAKGSSPQPVAPKPGADAPAEPGKNGGSLTDALTRPADDKVLHPVTEDVVGAVGNGVVRPVGDLVETVTTGLTGTVGIPAGSTLPGWPTLPSFPESPSWPTLPTVPGVPTVPGLPGIPGRTLPAPAPVTSAPQPQPGDHAVTRPADDEGSAGDGGVYGPRFAGHGTVTEAAVHSSGHRTTTSTAHAPAHQAPSDNQGGALGGKSAVDNGSSRHGDAQAVTLDDRAPQRLVPGAAASVDAAATRDRHRDIPVFPG
ncbi:hypothetical protein QFZ22_004183 [Streptomyces canus]|uniref:Secreted protein n=1 Tax=Streptomyces canus TaxID=58343 RepID=A0AAW8FHA0_9ACTN|nr:hypothetical protein [Streptomyces canus]MDQ0908198.1 hypothetical protein [Streptomyces canus]